jgi:hypothetical protein
MVDLIKKNRTTGRANDRINYGTVDESTINSGAGNDIITINNLIFSRIDGGWGRDTLRLTALGVDFFYDTSAKHWVVSVSQSGSGAYNSFLKRIERVEVKTSATAKSSIVYELVTPAQTNQKAQVKVTGTSGDDRIRATDSSANFQINAGAGNDRITASLSGKTTIDAGVGDDIVSFTASQVSAIALTANGEWQAQGADSFGVPRSDFTTNLKNVEKLVIGQATYELLQTGTVISSTTIGSGSSYFGTQANDVFKVKPGDFIDLRAGGNDVVQFTADRFNQSMSGPTVDIQGFKKDDKLDWSAFTSGSTIGSLTYDQNGFAKGELQLKLGGTLPTVTLNFFS